MEQGLRQDLYNNVLKLNLLLSLGFLIEKLIMEFGFHPHVSNDLRGLQRIFEMI